MSDVIITPQPPVQVEVTQTPAPTVVINQGVKGDKGDPGDGGGGLPVGGTTGQVLAKTASGPAWASFEDLTGWFENQLL